MADHTWVFGYGSLVSPDSLATTIGRQPGADIRRAHLDGYGRRWNYGSKTLRGDWVHDDVTVANGLVVSLGIAVADDEACNGVIFRVDGDEIARLDWRERDYERMDVTDSAVIDGAPIDGSVQVYFPRQSAIERYEHARDEGRAAVRLSYWNLVRDAFTALGHADAEWYAKTRPPDVPVVDVQLRSDR